MSLWNLSGVPQVFLWCLSDTPLVSLYDFSDVSLESLWWPAGVSVESLWCLSCVYLVPLWCLSGSDTGHLKSVTSGSRKTVRRDTPADPTKVGDSKTIKPSSVSFTCVGVWKEEIEKTLKVHIERGNKIRLQNS